MIDHGYSLKQLEDLSSTNPYYHHQVTATDIRLKAVQEAAMALGVQSGLFVESQRINHKLDGEATTLDKIFNFNLLVYHQHVLPPVIEHAKGSLNLGPMSQTIRINGETYNIIRQVKFVTAPPTWRDYLWMNYKKPKLTNRVLLPQNSKERAVWKTAVSTGYDQGIKQAVQIFDINLNLLKRNYNGMVLYKALLLRGMVSPFYVSEKAHGITGNKDHLVIDDHSMRIDLKPQLQLHSKLWNPILTNSHASLPKEPTGPNTIVNEGKWQGGPKRAPVITAAPINVKQTATNSKTPAPAKAAPVKALPAAPKTAPAKQPAKATQKAAPIKKLKPVSDKKEG